MADTLDPIIISDLPEHTPAGTDVLLLEDASETGRNTLDNIVAAAQSVQALQAAVNQLNSNLGGLKIVDASIPTGGSVTFTLSNSTRCLILCIGAATAVRVAYLMNCNASGNVAISDILSGSGVSYTLGTNSMTISNSTTNNACRAYFVAFSGSVSV